MINNCKDVSNSQLENCATLIYRSVTNKRSESIYLPVGKTEQYGKVALERCAGFTTPDQR